MRLLLVNPKLPESFWSFRWAVEEVLRGKRALNPPLGLATLAALCPPDWQVTIVDENVEPLPLRPEADVIGVCGMGVQAARQKQLLRFYRQAGYFTVAGGSYASLCPGEYGDVADAVVAGEAEYAWPRFCEDFRRGAAQALYREAGHVGLADSPVPRFDLLKLDRYATATLQLSRGCPYRCEFCDIIVMFGRRPRYKSVEQIGRELDALRALGARKIFFVDDNFIGNPARAKDTLRFLAGYQARHGWRLRFGTEASLNLSADAELMRLFREAGFEWVFLGLETPDPEALREARKTQNCSGDMLQAVRRIYASGIDILAGFIVGFDRDTPRTFGAQKRFIDGPPSRSNGTVHEQEHQRGLGADPGAVVVGEGDVRVLHDGSIDESAVCRIRGGARICGHPDSLRGPAAQRRSIPVPRRIRRIPPPTATPRPWSPPRR